MMEESNISTISGTLTSLPNYAATQLEKRSEINSDLKVTSTELHSVPVENSRDLSSVYTANPRENFVPTVTKVAWPESKKERNQEYFVLRPGTIEQAIEDIKKYLTPQEDGDMQSSWLLTEIDHWDNENERLVLITQKSMIICKYDFISLYCVQILRVPLHYIATVCSGEFTYTRSTLHKRQGHGLRIKWEKLQEPSFLTRWNPWSTDLPYITLTEHVVAKMKIPDMCQLDSFKAQLIDAAQQAIKESPLPGRANGLLILEQPIEIDTFVGLMAYVSNAAKLGYAKSRGIFSF
ncbi:tumor protein p63-regulated gene 1-like protein [Protopterus annectens]|uniref:tumor protein p63-regulated gene 1-like protein n=1 Tax=Protopterus annectens TaxID=7888 RepID=UPI001CFA5023|nr:tumor protein p63-regulated gene 1-like protein [Protopterus annectens]